MTKLEFAQAAHEALVKHFAGRFAYATVETSGKVVICVDGERWGFVVQPVDRTHNPISPESCCVNQT